MGSLVLTQRPIPPRRLSTNRQQAGSIALYFLASLLALAAGLAAFVFAIIGWSSLRSADWILPGVQAGEVSLGGLSRAEAAQKIEQEWNSGRILVATDGSQSYPVTPAELGLRIDAATTVERAYQAGRDDAGGALNTWAALLSGEMKVEPVASLDASKARSALDRLAARWDRPAQDAKLEYKDGHWQAIPGKPGRALDVEHTLAVLAQSPGAVLMGGYLPLAVHSTAPGAADLSAEAARLEEKRLTPLHLAAYDPINDQTLAWDVPAETFAAWVKTSQENGQVSMDLDADQLRAYLAEWEKTIQPERKLQPGQDLSGAGRAWQAGQPFTILLRRQPSSYAVQPGDTAVSVAWKTGIPAWKIIQANLGTDLGYLRVGQTLTIPSPNDLLPLPVVMGKRIMINIPEQRLRVYENGQVIHEWAVSTGIASSPTQPGVFQVRGHELNAYAENWDLWMPHFLGIYEAWPGFTNGIHGLPTLSNGRLLWANVLGRPASYGCIILPLDSAEWLYNWAEDGVVVEIQ